MSTHLIGGGWDDAATADVYGPFLESAGTSPQVACVVLDEGDGEAQFRRWATVLQRTATCEPVPVLVPLGQTLQVAALGDADGLLVCGGLTPAYADALGPVAADVRGWLAAGDRAYCGFSAGAAVASTRALVGGWLVGGVPVCPEDAAEDLEELGVVPGLGLIDVMVDVHCAQWGTLPRLLAALGAGDAGLALDENTALHLSEGAATVTGAGAVRHVRRSPDGVAAVTAHLADADLTALLAS
jgi:cyanophycinase